MPRPLPPPPRLDLGPGPVIPVGEAPEGRSLEERLAPIVSLGSFGSTPLGPAADVVAPPQLQPPPTFDSPSEETFNQGFEEPPTTHTQLDFTPTDEHPVPTTRQDILDAWIDEWIVRKGSASTEDFSKRIDTWTHLRMLDRYINSNWPVYFEPEPLSLRGDTPPNPPQMALRGGHITDVTATKSPQKGVAEAVAGTYELTPKFERFAADTPVQLEWPGTGQRGALGGSLGKQHAIALSPLFEGNPSNLAFLGMHELMHAWDAANATKGNWVSGTPEFRRAAIAAGLDPVTFQGRGQYATYFWGLAPGDWAHVYNLPANFPIDTMSHIPLPLRPFYRDIFKEKRLETFELRQPSELRQPAELLREP